MSLPGNCIFQSTDQRISVYQNGNYRMLSFDHKIEQSRIHIHKPYRPLLSYIRAMLLASKLICEPKKVCLLGIGGGSLAHSLSTLWPKCRIQCIDNDAQIIDLLPRYFLLGTNNKMHLIVQDAEQYRRALSKNVDAIFIDLYDSHGMLSFGLSNIFVQQCFNQLSNDGVIVFNLWADNHLTHYFINEYLPDNFDDHQYLTLTVEGGNLIVMLFKHPLPSISRAEFRQTVESMEDSLEQPFQNELRNLFDDNPLIFYRK